MIILGVRGWKVIAWRASIPTKYPPFSILLIGVEEIPTACITVEDAEMMSRMAARGTKIVVNLKMEAKTLPPSVSRNTVAEIRGSVYPEQVSCQIYCIGHTGIFTLPN